jgi:type I restriction enzyme S subunit
VSLPDGWVRAPIGDLCDLINGKAFKPSDWCRDGLPIIRIQNLNRPNAEFNYFEKQVDPRFLIEPGELLFAWSGTPGTSFGAHIWDGPRAVLNQHIFRVRFDEGKIDKEFFRRAINAKLVELIGNAHGGVGLAHVTKGTFERTEVHLPPLNQQRRIVEKLDALTARLARARADLARAVILTARWRQTAYARLYGDRWGVGLQSFLSAPIRNGLSIKGSDQPPGIAALKLSALRSGTVDLSDVRFLPIDETRAAQYSIQTDDVLVSRGNGNLSLVGRAAVVSMPLGAPTTIFPDTAFRLRPDPEKADPQWLSRVWNSPRVRAQIEARARTTAGIWKISQGDLAEIQLPELPVDKQRSASAATEAAFARADRLEAEAARARALLDRLEAAILAKAFRGELVPQDPADEPAAVLLHRIRAQRASAPAAKRGRRPALVSA